MPVPPEDAHGYRVPSVEGTPADYEGPLRRALLEVQRTLGVWATELERSTDAVLHNSVATEELLRREQDAWNAYVCAAANLKDELRSYRVWFTSMDRTGTPTPHRRASA